MSETSIDPSTPARKADTASDLERRLGATAFGATLGLPPGDPSRHPRRAHLAPAVSDPRRCASCRAAEVAHPGVCDACARRADQAELDAACAFARGTIPRHFRWARLDAPELQERCDPRAVEAFAALFGGPMPLGIAVVGLAGSGKTSLACAVLARIHSRAVVGADHRLVERARRSFFVSAHALAEEVETMKRAGFGAKARGPVGELAHRAAVLVLDELPSGGDAAMRVVQARHDRERPTIVTTWQGEPEACATFGTGLTRRIYGTTIRCVASVKPHLRTV